MVSSTIVVLAAALAVAAAQMDNLLLHPLTLPTLMPMPQLQPFNVLAHAGTAGTVQAVAKVIPCTCGVFLSGQFKRGSQEQPKGHAALLQELDDTAQCGPVGEKHCVNRCLEMIVKHLSNSAPLICGTIDRDCHKERAYLFVQNCNGQWVNSNLSAGREYCCKDGEPYKCPSNL